MKSPADTKRIFLAVPAPEEIQTLQDNLRERNSHLKKVKWMRNYNIHLTLYFIGNIPSEELNEISAVITSVVEKQKRFSLDFDTLVYSPSRKPRMVWAKYKKSDSFFGFSNEIHVALSKFISSNRFYYPEPVPHITLARFHSVKNYCDILLPKNVSLSEIHVNSCELWETIQVAGRSDYRGIQTFPLS